MGSSSHSNSRKLSPVRRLVEWASRRVELNRRLPAQFGGLKLRVSPGAGGLGYWRHDISRIDPALLRIVLEFIQEGSTVYDIGANVGLFSFAAASRAGKTGLVVACEADTWLVSLLRRSADANPEVNVTVLPVAVSDGLGIARFHISSRARSANSLLPDSQDQTERGGKVHYVPAVSIDWLLEHFPLPDFVKVDVEGAEVLVLNGAEKLLSDVRPVIHCETHRDTKQELTDLFGTHHYLIFDAEKPPEQRVRVGHTRYNTLAIPEEKIETIPQNAGAASSDAGENR